MSEPQSIREKIGLDYLFTQPEPPRVERFASSAQEPGSPIDTALLAVGGRLMGALADSPDRRGRLYDLVDSTGITIEPMLGAILKLESLGLVRLAERDPKGNHLAELTPDGVAAFHL